MNRLPATIMALGFATFFAACTADVEDEGSLPDVDVSGGEMPDVDIDPADVDVTTDTQTIVTPDIDINTDEDADEEPDTVPGA